MKARVAGAWEQGKAKIEIMYQPTSASVWLCLHVSSVRLYLFAEHKNKISLNL
jgi:hypothetical protein